MSAASGDRASASEPGTDGEASASEPGTEGEASASERRQAPRVSVVMIFFQAERFIEEAIKSVLCQTEDNFELLLVDDGSTDGGPAIAARMAGEDSRLRIIRHPDRGNHGMSAARNLGVREAASELVAFLDADDVWDPEHLELQLATLDRHPQAGAVCGRSVHWRTWQDPDAEDVVTGRAFPPEQLVRPPDMLLAYLDDGWTTVPTCALLTRRDVLLSCGGSDERFRGMFEDTVLLSKLYLSTPVVHTEAVTSRYRQHSDSTVAKATSSGEFVGGWASPARRRFLEWLDGYVTAQGVDDSRLRAAIARELQPYHPPWKLPARRALSAAARRARQVAPPQVRQVARRARGRVSGTGVGTVRFGALRRVEPISRDFGFTRGGPVDRYYIEGFLDRHRADVRGRVLEVGDDSYTRQFGGDKVAVADVVHIHAANSRATFIGDISDATLLPDEAFDCIVLTQTLHLIYDMAGAIRNLHRSLKPGGVLLVTVPGISHLAGDEWQHNWLWAVTPAAATRLFGEVFGSDAIEVAAHGNVLATVAFLHGVSAQELRPDELDRFDSQYPMLVTVRAVRAEAVTA